MYIKQRAFRAATFILSFIPTLIIAQPADEPPANKPPIADEIVVKGKKEGFTESVEIREIRESNARDAGEALEKVEGVSKIRKGGIANDIDIRGMKRDNINIFIDGQRLHGACPNRMDPASFHVDFAEVETIEIIKGPYNVKNPGGIGGEVDIKTKEIKKGLNNEINLSGGSFDTKEGSFRSSYATDAFGFLVGGSAKTAQPYIDGNGKRITEQYPDFDDPSSLLFSPYASADVLAAMAQMNALKALAPAQFAATFPDFPASAPPSANRYKYGERKNDAYEMRTAWIKTFFKPTEKQKIELSYTKQETENIFYPYLMMDANYDNAARTAATYTIEDLTSKIEQLKVQVYDNQVKHLMTDEFRCSSTNSTNECYLPMSQSFGMATYATTRTTGGKIETTFKVLGKTTVGVDTYHRNWNTTTTTRVKHFKDTSMPMMQNNYRDQASIPDVTTDNIGAYFENESKLSSKLKLNTGLRHDKAITKAGKDRRILYNAYFPGFDPLYQFQYAKASQNGIMIAPGYMVPGIAVDAEIYIPQAEPTVVDEMTAGNARLTYEINDRFEVFAGFGHGARLPDPQERFFALQRMGNAAMPDSVGNPHLKVTKNDQGDLGFKYFNGKILWKVQGFYSKVYDYVVTRYASDTYIGKINPYNDPLLYNTYTNVVRQSLQQISGVNRIARSYKNVDATMYGGESSVRITLPKDLFTGAGLSYVRGINDTERLELQEMPPLRGNIWLRFDNGKYFTEAEGVFAATQTRVDRAIGEKQTPGWGIANIKAGAEFGGLKLVTGVRNIFDRYYYEHLSYSREPFATGIKVPEPGRSWFVSMQWAF